MRYQQFFKTDIWRRTQNPSSVEPEVSAKGVVGSKAPLRPTTSRIGQRIGPMHLGQSQKAGCPIISGWSVWTRIATGWFTVCRLSSSSGRLENCIRATWPTLPTENVQNHNGRCGRWPWTWQDGDYNHGQGDGRCRKRRRRQGPLPTRPQTSPSPSPTNTRHFGPTSPSTAFWSRSWSIRTGHDGGIIDGNHRKKIADELGYDCPEIVQAGLEEDEKRTMARALNLARRQLSSDQKREIIADQLKETPERSIRWIGKMLGVDHTTVGSVRS